MPLPKAEKHAKHAKHAKKTLLVFVAALIISMAFPFTPVHAKLIVSQSVSPHYSYSFTLEDFYSDNPELDAAVDWIMSLISDKEKIAQMVMTSCGKFGRLFNQVQSLLGQRAAGAVVFQGVTVADVEKYTILYRNIAEQHSLLYPFFAVDGEPSLISEKIIGIRNFPSTGSISSIDECRTVAGDIAHTLRDLYIHITFAPVCDFSMNNQVIGSRSFGSDTDRVSTMAAAFVRATQAHGIAATAKHFPGHGTAYGDSHKKLVFINGIPPEIPVFQNVIDAGVLIVMVGHIGVEDDGMYLTNGLPSTFSEKIIKEVLKGALRFRGIVITDSLNMDAVRTFPEPALTAVLAGCDMVLMPEREIQFIDKLYVEMEKNPALKRQVMESVSKIIRLKLCFGLINYKALDKSVMDVDINR